MGFDAHSDEAELKRLRGQFEELLSDMNTRFESLCGTWERKIDSLHAQNVSKLAAIDHTTRNTSETVNAATVAMTELRVKVDAMYGNGSGKLGAIEKLDAKVGGLADKVLYGCGGVAATVLLVGWWLAMHKI